MVVVVFVAVVRVVCHVITQTIIIYLRRVSKMGIQLIRALCEVELHTALFLCY